MYILTHFTILAFKAAKPEISIQLFSYDYAHQYNYLPPRKALDRQTF